MLPGINDPSEKISLRTVDMENIMISRQGNSKV